MTSLSAIAVLTLAAGLAQLCTRHLGALVGLSVVQGLAVVLALLVDAWFGAAAVVLVLSVVRVALRFAGLPALHAAPAAVGSPGWGLPGWGLPGWGLPGWGLPGWGLALGTAGAALAAQIPVVGLPFAVLLAGLVVVATRPDPGPRVLGLLAMQHGIVLAACLHGEADGVTILVAALPIVPFIMLASIPWPWQGTAS